MSDNLWEWCFENSKFYRECMESYCFPHPRISQFLVANKESLARATQTQTPMQAMFTRPTQIQAQRDTHVHDSRYEILFFCSARYLTCYLRSCSCDIKLNTRRGIPYVWAIFDCNLVRLAWVIVEHDRKHLPSKNTKPRCPSHNFTELRRQCQFLFSQTQP